MEEAKKVTFESVKFLELIPRGKFMLTLVVSAVLILLTCGAMASKRPAAWALAVSSVLFSSALASIAGEDIYLNVGLAFVLMLVFIYLLKHETISVLAFHEIGIIYMSRIQGFYRNYFFVTAEFCGNTHNAKLKNSVAE